MQALPQHDLDYKGYAAIAQAHTPSMMEANALKEAARRISVALDESADKDTVQTDAKLLQALQLNRRLWTIFHAELINGPDEMPDEIRLNMLTLSKYVDRHTAKCLIEPTTRNVQILINISNNIGDGLKESSEPKAA